MWQYTTECNSSTNEGVELFVTSDGQLEVARSDALDFEVLGSILDAMSASYSIVTTCSPPWDGPSRVLRRP